MTTLWARGWHGVDGTTNSGRTALLWLGDGAALTSSWAQGQHLRGRLCCQLMVKGDGGASGGLDKGHEQRRVVKNVAASGMWWIR
jgi:hypothetical protein